MRIFWLACFIAAVVLFFAGYVAVGFGVFSLWSAYRLWGIENTVIEQTEFMQQLLVVLISDFGIGSSPSPST